MTYVFIGQDNLSKSTQLKKIKQEFLAKGCEQFNFDLLYAKELNLKVLQESLLCLPVKSPQRIIAIKQADNLTSDLKKFIIKYVRSPFKKIILILDMERQEKADEFLKSIYSYVKIIRFKETQEQGTFTLSNWIERKKPDYAIRVLNQILQNGEKPERILGGLRYVWETSAVSPSESKRRLSLLLNCDRDIKTGRLKPNFALEKLVIGLCFLPKPFR